MEIIHKNSFKPLRVVLFVISITLFLISLTQITYVMEGSGEGMLGFMALLLGWLNLFGAGISWCANLMMPIAWILLLGGKIKKSLLLSFIAVLFCLLFLAFDDIIANEGGSHSKIVHYGLGYWLWLLSSITMVLGNVLVLHLRDDPDNN